MHGASGGYGLQLGEASLPVDRDLLAPADVMPWSLRWERAELGGAFDIGADAACVPATNVTMYVDRLAQETVLRSPVPLSSDEVVHPYFATTGALAAHWSGRPAFHAAVLAGAEGAWGVLGDREAGKSTMMAAMLRHGVEVVADDLLVVDDGSALAGPRCIDLRQQASETLGLGVPLGVVGARHRWRHGLGPIAARVPLAGFVVLRWGDEPSLERIPVRSRLDVLGAALTVRVAPSEPASLVELLGLPMWRLTRPRSWDDLPRSVDLVAQLLG